MSRPGDGPSSRTQPDRKADALVEIAPLEVGHWPRVAEIYAEGIATGDATFETEVPTWEHWDGMHLPDRRLGAWGSGELLGWAALAPVSARPVYAGVTECSVYVAEEARGRGVGRRLLEALVRDSEQAGIWTVQAGIFAENAGSVALHARCGFRVVGIRERIGLRNGVWRDVLLMERRSALIVV